MQKNDNGDFHVLMALKDDMCNAHDHHQLLWFAQGCVKLSHVIQEGCVSTYCGQFLCKFIVEVGVLN